MSIDRKPEFGAVSLDRTADMDDARKVASRRELLRAGCGFGQLALLWMLLQDGALGSAQRRKAAPSSGLPPKRKARADAVIFLFMQGGPSHIDLFDPKPLLNRRAGQPLPTSIFRSRPVHTRPILASPRTFRKYGKSGMTISDLYPLVGQQADHLCLIRSCVSESANHAPAIQEINTGSFRFGRPSLGAWSLYGLGSVNKNLPGFVVLTGDQDPVHRPEAWGAGFLSPRFEGITLKPDNPPMANIDPPPGMSRERARATLDFVGELNRRYRVGKEDVADLEARTAAYELAFRMQSSAHQVVDFSRESVATRKLYGLDDPVTEEFGKRCLVARRLVERGVRFVQVYCGHENGWDAHDRMGEKYPEICARTDRPVAGLLADLAARGMLERTLVIWGGEFGRTPTSISGTGRDHNPTGYSMWLAGGGAAGGRVIGATDDFGMWAEDEPCHVNDLHATILHLIGLETSEITVHVNGRDEHPTVKGGSVIAKALA